jgi:hypothetical protein
MISGQLPAFPEVRLVTVPPAVAPAPVTEIAD